MTDISIFAGAGDGCVRNMTQATWAAARGNASGTLAQPSIANGFGAYVGKNGASDWDCIRGFLPFDLSSIPAGAIISAATLSVQVNTVYDLLGSGGLGVVEGTQASASTLATSDFSHVGSTELATRKTLASLSTSVYTDFALNASGIAILQAAIGGTAQLALRTGRDIDNTTPGSTNYEGVLVYFSEQTGTSQDPVLTVTYNAVAKSATDSAAETDASAVAAVLGPSSIVATDPFTGTDGTLLENHAPSSGSWTRLSDTNHKARISSNRLTADSVAAVNAIYQHSATVADGWIKGTAPVLSAGGYVGLYGRISGSNFYLLIVDNGGLSTAGNLTLLKYPGGTTLQSVSSAWSSGDTVEFRHVGNVLTAYVNGVPKINYTDSGGYTTGSPGLVVYAPNGRDQNVALDNLEIGTFSGVAAETATATETATVIDPTVVSKSASEAPTAAEGTTGLSVRVDPTAGAAGSDVTRTTYGSIQTVAASAGGVGAPTAYPAYPWAIQLLNGKVRAYFIRNTAEAISGDGLSQRDGTYDAFSGSMTWSTEILSPTCLTSGGTPVGIGQMRRAKTTSRILAPATLYTTKWNAYFGYSADDGASWSTAVPITNAYTNHALPAHVVELDNGDYVVCMYGTNTGGLFDIRTSKSVDQGASWTAQALVAAGATYGYNAVEPQMDIIRGIGTYGRLVLSFQIENGDVNSGMQYVYTTYSDDGGATWATPTRVQTNNANRTNIFVTPDNDVMLGWFNVPSWRNEWMTSTDGITFTNEGVLEPTDTGTNNKWVGFAAMGAAGATPNVYAIWARGNFAQTLCNVYGRMLTRGATAPTPGSATETGAAAETSSVNILSTVVPKAGSDTGAATEASSVAASTPAPRTGSDTGTASETGSIVEIEAPVVIAAGNYDLRLGRVRLPTLLDSLKESVGEQLETAGATAVAGERRAKPATLTIPVHATGSDGKTVADRMRRQIRALLNNPAARLGALYLAFTPDTDLSGWLLIGSGDLEYSDGGIVFGDYKLSLGDAYVVGRQRSHVAARRIEVLDRRDASVPRDIKGTIFSAAFSTVTPAAVAYLPGSSRYLWRGRPITGTPVASVASLMGTGTPQLITGLADGDLVILDGPPSDDQLQAAELGDVIVLDRQAVVATGATAARDVTPQSSYGWEELYGLDQAISYPSGFPSDVIVQNGVCRVSVSSSGIFTVDRMTSTGFSPACTVNALIPNMSALQLRDAAIVHWTPDETVVRFELDNSQASPLAETIGRCEMYVTLRRGWDAPRFEAYLTTAPATAVVRLRVMHAIAGTTALDTSTTGASNIADDTDYGNFSARDPWLGLSPSSGPVILAAVTRSTDKIRGRVVGSQRGVEVYDPTAATLSYASVQLSITTAGAAASYGPIHAQRCMVDVKTIPTLLPR